MLVGYVYVDCGRIVSYTISHHTCIPPTIAYKHFSVVTWPFTYIHTFPRLPALRKDVAAWKNRRRHTNAKVRHEHTNAGARNYYYTYLYLSDMIGMRKRRANVHRLYSLSLSFSVTRFMLRTRRTPTNDVCVRIIIWSVHGCVKVERTK